MMTSTTVDSSAGGNRKDNHNIPCTQCDAFLREACLNVRLIIKLLMARQRIQRNYDKIKMQDIERGVVEDLFGEGLSQFKCDREIFKQCLGPDEQTIQEPCSKALPAVQANEIPGVTVPDRLPRLWSRSRNHIKRLNTQLLEAIEDRDVKEVERLLRTGASPNATCRLGHVSACHLAASAGGGALELLLKFGAVYNRRDERGRQPLHLAAWSGTVEDIGILLDSVSDELCYEINKAQTEEGNLSARLKDMVNVQCEVNDVIELPETWEDSIVHNCRDTIDSLPLIEMGWSPLHAASSNARPHCARSLLAAGADPNLRDPKGRTPLDVAGSAVYCGGKVTAECFREVIEVLLKADGKLNSKLFKELDIFHSSLHTAVELGSLDAIKQLLDAGASNTCLNCEGQAPLHLCVRKRLRKPLQVLLNYNDAETLSATPPVDVKDKDGYTVLHAAVKDCWLPGVRVALEAGADVVSMAKDGETPLHTAAASGDVVVLNELISIAKQYNVLDYKNQWGETALFIAVINGQLNCLKMLLNAGASIEKAEFANKHILHEAAFRGNFDVLQVLLSYDDATVEYMFKYKHDLYLWSPEHFAIINNHVECFNALFAKHIEIRQLYYKTPYDASEFLITAAEYNRLEIAERIIAYDRTTVYAKNDALTPFKVALSRDSRDVLRLLLFNGISLSNWYDDVYPKGTVINSIMYILKKPTEFLHNIFEESIYKNDYDFQDPICRIVISYRILLTNTKTEQMKVLRALLETGNEHGQRKLLLHPVVESFLCLKWMVLSSFFYAIILIISLFVLSLNIFVMSIYYCKDTGKPMPVFLDPAIWKYFVYSTAILVAVLECMNIMTTRKFSLRTCFKFICIGLAAAIPSIITAESLADAEWPRHVSTVALLNTWLEMMILLSQTPYWGYYVLMFRRVASKVVKILLTFVFVVFAFAFSFTIQFHSKKPFEDPWAAIVKTIVMMTSEFDYKDTFDLNNSKEISASVLVWRILFLVFVILIAIVLMNLMVGVAVTDLHNLVHKRRQKIVEDLIIFLDSLEGLARHRLLPSFLKGKIVVDGILRIVPSEPSTYKHIPAHVVQDILKRVHAQQDLNHAKQGNDDSPMCVSKADEINKKLTQMSMDINNKMEQMSLEINDMKQMLNKSK